MADATTTATTEAPKQAGGFPPFKTDTFPSQIFWLAITFAFLFVVLWRVAGPRINGVITSRRGTINADIAAADKARGDAESASAAYQTRWPGPEPAPRAWRKKTARSCNRRNRQGQGGCRSRGGAAPWRRPTPASPPRASRHKAHVIKAAEEAAIAIVARLTGETVSSVEAAAAP